MPDAPTILCPPAGVSTGRVSVVPPTPVAAPGTPALSEVPAPSDTPSGEPAKPDKPKKTPKRVKVEPASPLEKGRDLEKQILAKKGECGNLTTQIRTLDFGGGLAQELSKYVEQFEFLVFEHFDWIQVYRYTIYLHYYLVYHLTCERIRKIINILNFGRVNMLSRRGLTLGFWILGPTCVNKSVWSLNIGFTFAFGF